MNKLLLIIYITVYVLAFFFLFCTTSIGDIEKVNEIALPYWPESIRDPNQLEPYMRELVSELEKIIDQIRDTVNHGVDLDNPDIRYFDLPDADGEYADDTWRTIAVDDGLEIQKKIDGTWTEIATWTEDGFTFTATDITITGTLTAPYVTVTSTLTSTGETIIGNDPNYVKFTANGTMFMYGDARVQHHISITAVQFRKGATAPVEGYENIYPTLLFNDNQDDEAHYSTIVPSDWDDTTDMEFEIHWQHDTVAKTGKVLWNLSYIAADEGDDPAGAGTNIAQLSAGNHAADALLSTAFDTALLAANMNRMDTLGLKVWRNGDDGTDNLTEDAEIIGIHLHYTANTVGIPLETFYLLLETGGQLLLETGGGVILEGI